ncbi:MAG TPA: transketolase C-terminal domain-containing protein [Gemmataceae bacterium]|nr:transketolase C-terminal domain-containing protein [Gemmataceae bacterium]
MNTSTIIRPEKVNVHFDWRQVARLVLTSRAMDALEETELYPQRKINYQFSARGHDLSQILLGSLLTHPHDAAGAYYRSRPFLLAVGLSIEESFAAALAKSGGFSAGRDIGAVCNLPSRGWATVLPMAGEVGSQYTPCAGWAQAIVYRRDRLKEEDYEGAIAVALGGEGSVASNGFWSALTIATTLKLPMLFYIEDNAYSLSVPGDLQTPGGNIAANLKSFTNLVVRNGDGTDPAEASALIKDVVGIVRSGRSPALLRLTVPRLCGHSGQDTQAYKSQEFIEEERARDPLDKLYHYLVPALFSETEWRELDLKVHQEVETALQAALRRPDPDPGAITRYLFTEKKPDGSAELQQVGGLAREGHCFPSSSEHSQSEPTRINMLAAIRRTLEVELRTNPKLLVFGEDVGPKGGVHGVTMGLQELFGEARVFDTSLSEEGIIGRAVGMALSGLLPVTEIQFRKYADTCTEQLSNCGTIRWRTANRFAAPMVVRVPGGFAKCGDPWHSVCNEVQWIHGLGWQVVFPSNAEDAVGLLRAALRSNDPTIFFEHRNLLDNAWARRPYPGDQFVLPLGKAKLLQEGTELTIVTWGAMVQRCEAASKQAEASVELLDLRTLSPWDKETVLASVRKTRRCLIVHEDTGTAGFGAEISAVVAREAFFSLDAPIERITTAEVPIPYNVDLMNAVLPSVDQIAAKIRELVEF